MGKKLKTIKDIELKDKHVLLRADYNVPLKDGEIADDYRVRQSIPTVEYILRQSPKSLVIISHLGRPKGPGDKTCSLAPVAKRLSRLLDKKVGFTNDCIGEEAQRATAGLPHGGLLLFENLRFHPEEENNDKNFAKALLQASVADVFVADGFGVAHRAHASTEAITSFLPSVAGLLLSSEVETITRVMENPARPFTAVVGGAKITDKIDVLDRFVEIADCVAIGGALANTFLAAGKTSVGRSLYEPEAFDIAKEVLAKAKKAEKERNFNFLIPIDVVVSRNLEGKVPTRIVDLAAHTYSDIVSYPKKPPPTSYTLSSEEKIMDIGPASAAQIAGAVKMSNTVVWSGALGVTEIKGIAGAADPFGHGTRTVAQAMIGASNLHAHKPFSLVGGGDTVSYIRSQGLTQDFNHVSTGGSACLELLAGHKLPGVEALENK